jgi:hypothetical protein
MKVLSTKNRTEREEEEAERLVRPLPKLKPPRKDRRREEMQVDGDPDVEGDPDTKSDPDMSLNRREVGGSASGSSYWIGNSKADSMKQQDLVRQPVRTAIYHGITPNSVGPYPKWEQAHIRDLSSSDFDSILGEAKVWLKSPILSSQIEGMEPDARFRAALDLSIRDSSGGKYSSAINAALYDMLLVKLVHEG